MKRRILSLAMALFVTVSILPAKAFASPADSGTAIVAAGLCEHHTQHDQSCGYSEGTVEIPCSHEHTDDCYAAAEQCIHQHDEDCGGLTDPAACTHQCSEESGCITKTLDCRHEHDEACGYAPAVEGTPCTYECEICGSKVENQPEEVPGGDECTCTTLCTEGAADEACPVCGAEGADLSACQGKAPEAVCTCTTLCTEGAADEACPVCGAEGADLSACQGKAPEAVCTCTTPCAEGAMDETCPVCGADGADPSVCAAQAIPPLMAPKSGERTIRVGGKDLTVSETNPVVYAINGWETTVETDGANENNYNVKWDGTTLTLRNARTFVSCYGDLTIECIGTNTVEEFFSAAIHVMGGNLTFTGNGSLRAEIAEGSQSSAICSEGTITVQGAAIESNCAIQAREGFIFRSGSVWAAPNSSSNNPSIQIENRTGVVAIDPAEGQMVEIETKPLGKQYYTSRTELTRDMFYGMETSMKISDANIFVGGTGLHGTGKQPAYAKTDANGAVTLDGSETDYNIKWDGSTLTLKDALIKSSVNFKGITAAVYAMDDVTVALEGSKSTIDVPGNSNGIYVTEDLSFKANDADSILSITAGGDCAIYNEGNLKFDSGTIYVDGGTKNSIHSRRFVTVNGGHVIVGQNVGSPEGIHSVEQIDINGGIVEIKDKVKTGISGEFSFVVSGGTLKIAAETVGIHLDTTGGMFFRGGDTTIGAGETGISNRGGPVAFENGNVTITAKTGVDTQQEEARFVDGHISITASGTSAVRAKSATVSGGDVTVTSAGNAFSLTDGLLVQPPSDKSIVAKTGADASSATPILGSPFETSAVVWPSDPYFHSEVSTETYQIYVGGVGLHGSAESPAYARTNESGTVAVGGSESDYNIKWDGSTLTLRSADITGVRTAMQDTDMYAASISRLGDLEIVLMGENTVRTGTTVDDASSYAVYAGSNVYSGTNGHVLRISGTGILIAESSDLNVVNTDKSLNSAGIFAANSLIIEEGVTVFATGGEAQASDCRSSGICAGYNGVGTVSLSGNIAATGSEATESYGIRIGGTGSGDMDVTLSGTIYAAGQGFTAPPSYNGYVCSYGIRVNSARTLDILGKVTAIGGPVAGNGCDSFGLRSNNVVTVKQDAVLTASGGEVTGGWGNSLGIESWNSILITGGKVTATGGKYGLCTRGSFAANTIRITGGEVIATATNEDGQAISELNGSSAAFQPAEDRIIQIMAGDSAESAEEVIGSPVGYTENGTTVTVDGLYFHCIEKQAPNIYVGGVGLYGDKDHIVYARTGADGAVTEDGSASDYDIKWDGETLTLNGARITTARTTLTETAAVYREGGLKIELQGENSITGVPATDASSYGIYVVQRVTSSDTVPGDLAISGTGSLNVTAGTATGASSDSCGIYASGSIAVSGGSTVIAQGGEAGALSTGIYGVSQITETGSQISATGGKAATASLGLYSDGTITLTGGEVTASGGEADQSHGIYVIDPITIQNGANVIATGGAAISGSCGICTSKGSIKVSGSTVAANGGKADQSHGIHAYNSVIVLDGADVTAAGSTAVESYGISVQNDSVEVSGSIVIANGGEADRSYGIYAYNAVIVRDAANVAATGGTATDSYGIRVQNGSVEVADSTIAALSGEADDASGMNGDNTTTVTAIGGTASDSSYGIYTYSPVAVGESTNVVATGGAAVNNSCGIYTQSGDVEITSGIITAAGGDASDPQGTSYGIRAGTGSVIISGGEITALSGEASQSQGIFGGTNPIIVNPLNGGAIEVKAGADEDTALQIEGSPFEAREEITALLAEQKFVRTRAGIAYTITVEASENGAVTAPEKALEGSTVTLVPAPNSGYRMARWEITPAVEISGNSFVMPGEPVTVKAVFERIPSSGGSSDSDKKREFWEKVRDAIEDAEPGETVKAEARSNDRMPYWVMDALREADDVTLRITWNGGEDIIIPSGAAPAPEAHRIYYPLSYLAEMDFTVPADQGGKVNPETGGILAITTPEVSSAETEEITDSRRGLAETPELRDEGVEQAIPGVYEPEGTRSMSSILPWITAAGILLAAGGFWFWKRRTQE